MNSDSPLYLLQRGFHVTLGATASLIETLQNPQKWEENFNRLGSDLNRLTEEWAEKGVTTEQEARDFVDTVMAQSPTQAQPHSNTDGTTVNPNATPGYQSRESSSQPTPNEQVEIDELTDRLAAMQAELERLKSQENPESDTQGSPDA